MKLIGAAIVGGTGYGAGELLRLITQHPQIDVVSVTSSSSAGKQLAEAHPHLAGFYDLQFDTAIDFKKLEHYQKKVVFLGLPHGTSANAAIELLPELDRIGALLIDLSGDFRLNDPAIRGEFYPEVAIENALQQRFAYGLTELNREKISAARFLATPGCLAAVCILGAAPLAADPDFSSTLVFDVKTGTSGGGRSLKETFHHPTRHGNLTPYKVLEHRHEPEILQALGDPHAKRLAVSFVPHIIPASRGCFATIYLNLKKETNASALLQKFADYYAGEPFIRIRTTAPDLQNVVGTNFCDIGVVCRGEQVVVMSALDNLIKGTAGQAIQNLNLLCGLAETTGLWAPALGPS